MATRNQIVIQRAAQVRDNKGGFSTTWSNLFPNSIFAAIRNFGGAIRPLTSKGGDQATKKITFELRFVPGVVEGDRVLYAGRAYLIQHVDNVDERFRFLILTCDGGTAP